MKKHKSPAKSSKIAESGQFRLIGGKWRGRKLEFPAVEGLRPTPDRVRETIFNWLFDIKELNCLDLFAGSGSLGLEALSRGAKHCLFIDQSMPAAKAIQSHLALLDASGIAKSLDVTTALASLPTDEKFDLVFLDPPYNLDIISKCLQTLKASNTLNNAAIIYIENDSHDMAITPPEGFSILKEKTQGQVRFSLLSFQAD